MGGEKERGRERGGGKEREREREFEPSQLCLTLRGIFLTSLLCHVWEIIITFFPGGGRFWNLTGSNL